MLIMLRMRRRFSHGTIELENAEITRLAQGTLGFTEYGVQRGAFLAFLKYQSIRFRTASGG